jgi:AraC-like DNA-binding protein
MTDTQPLVRTDHVSDFGRWTLFRRRPSAALAPYVHEIQGYFEEGGDAIVRREVPSGAVPLILVFGPGFTLWDRGQRAWRPLERSFIAGLHQHAALVGSQGRALCMQVDFTPWGASRFLRSDMNDLVDKVVDLDELTGAFADRLEERLSETIDWAARFDLLEQAILRRIGDGTGNPLVTEAWHRLERARGAIAIGTLARDLDCSRKHLAMLFRRHVGLPPKTMARIFRFERALQGLTEGHAATLADLASECGYADQAHFNRDFSAFAGETPRELRARILPDGTGIMAPAR